MLCCTVFEVQLLSTKSLFKDLQQLPLRPKSDHTSIPKSPSAKTQILSLNFVSDSVESPGEATPELKSFVSLTKQSVFLSTEVGSQ